MDVGRYLDRIGAEWPAAASPTLDRLATLQRRHVLSVPFENLDIVAGRPIPLDRAAYYGKVIERGRGGFCYELNGLFAWLLDALGFDVRLVEGRVLEDHGFTPRFAHAAVLVDLGADGPPSSRSGWHLADVGFGRFARRPLPLTGEPRRDVEGTYRVRPLDDAGFEAQRRSDDGWTAAYQFTPDARVLGDFEDGLAWNVTSPDSAFTGRVLCTQATESGRVTLSTRGLTITEDGERATREVAPDERAAVLEAAFGLDVEGPLWLPDERPA
ncbi:MAG: arylamine N-acetyltransferase [Halobacteriales archaeon]